MPTEEKSQHDFISERRFAAGRTEVSLEAMDATEHRLAGLNELRNAMADQQQLFAKKEVIDTSLKAINDKIDSAASLASVGSGRQLGIATTMTAMGVVVALLLSLGELLVLLLKH